jgi:hypothetical protein
MASKARETGWKSMPVSIKVIFVLLCVGLVGYVNNLLGVYQYGYSFFGAYAKGIAAIFLSLVFPLAAQLILVIGLWKRASWAGWYGFIFYLVMIVFSLLGLLNVDNLMNVLSEKMIEQNGEPFPEGFSNIFYWAITSFIIIGSVVRTYPNSPVALHVINPQAN